MKIENKINLILITVFIIATLISGIVLSKVLQSRAQSEISSNAQDLMHVANSVRKYTNIQVRPILNPKLDTEEEFIPQTIPTYSVREVFDIFRTDGKYSSFFYKDAALNPTNLRDKADKFEARIVKSFQLSSDPKPINGYRNMRGENLFYVASPFKIKEESCLRCHSSPDKAPKSQIEAYGKENGFGWKLNEIVATQMIYVPAEEIINSANRSFLLVMGVLCIIFAVIGVVMNIFLKKIVLRRIKKYS